MVVRVSALSGAVENDPDREAAAITLVEAEGRIAYDRLTLSSASDGHAVLTNLTAEIPHGTNALVVGSDETARTALFGATAGVWPAGSGTVTRPPLDSIPFCPSGRTCRPARSATSCSGMVCERSSAMSR